MNRFGNMRTGQHEDTGVGLRLVPLVFPGYEIIRFGGLKPAVLARDGKADNRGSSGDLTQPSMRRMIFPSSTFISLYTGGFQWMFFPYCVASAQRDIRSPTGIFTGG